SEKWKLHDSFKDIVMDFSDSNVVVNIGYYKGTVPGTGYKYTVNYHNKAEEDAYNTDVPLFDSIVTPEQSFIIPANINFKNENPILVNDKNIYFIVDNLKITYPDGVTKVLDNYEEYNVWLPTHIEGSSESMTGEYTVDIYYKPIVTVTFKEYIVNLDSGESEKSDDKQFNILYDTNEYKFEPTEDLEEYKIKEVKIDGTSINPTDFDFSLTTDKYNKTVEITYEPITYNLTVEAISTGVKRNQVLYAYKNAPIKSQTIIDIPTFTGYTYKNMETVNNTPTEYLDSSTGVFTPTESGNYKVNLYYNQKSTVTTNYKLIDGTQLAEPKIQEGLISENIILKTPSEVPIKYELDSAYVDNIKYDNVVSGSEYSFMLKKSQHTVNLYYKEASSYNVEIIEGSGGEAFGGGIYFASQNISIMAWPFEGYEFDKWTVEGDDSIIITNPDEYILAFDMPNHNIKLKANFIKTDDDSYYSDNYYDDDDYISSKVKESQNNPIIETPEDDNESDNNWKEEKLYKIYITGYPDNTVRPNDSLKRQEVVQIIYNLYGDPNENIDTTILNKFSDVDKNSWYAQALAFCVNTDVISGYTDGTFKPNSDITREELSVILAKFITTEDVNSKMNFTDIGESWSTASIEKLYGAGIITGYPDGTFKPKNPTTRAEFVSLINRLIQRPITFTENITFTDLPKTHWAYNDLMNAANGGIKE
ncbi:MAG: S-layer homology domain-containing protein, partial [Coprobacillaceae bacterium]